MLLRLKIIPNVVTDLDSEHTTIVFFMELVFLEEIVIVKQTTTRNSGPKNQGRSQFEKFSNSSRMILFRMKNFVDCSNQAHFNRNASFRDANF